MDTTNSRHGAVSALTALSVAFVIAAASAPPALADTYHGAIAYAGNLAEGTSYDYPTKEKADQTAITACGFSDCIVLSSFTDCGAVAYNGKRLQGGYGTTLAAAQQDAISKLGGGTIDTWACN